MKNNYKQKGFLSSSFTVNLLRAAVFIFALAVLLIFSYSIYLSFSTNSTQSSITKKEAEIVNSIKKNYSSTTEEINQLLDGYFSKEMNTLEDYKQNLEYFSQFENIKRATVSSEPLNTIKPQAYPKINFATLDQLRKTKETNSNSKPEIHLYGNSDQYLNFIRIIDNDKNWYLIISTDTKNLFNDLPRFNIDNAKIMWEQIIPGGKNLILKTWGNLKSDADKIVNKQNVFDSQFLITSEFQESNAFLSKIGLLPSLGGIALSLILFGILARSVNNTRKLNLQKQKELKNYVPVPNMKIDSGESDTQDSTSENNQSSQQQSQEEKTKVLDKNIFRAYDIRGIVDKSLTSDAVKLIGQAIGTENLNRGNDQIVVARDGRLSGPLLIDSLIEGLVKSGNNVINIGAVPTGVLYFATHHLETGSGVMLTGSHNPSNYNGLKIMLNGETLAGDLITNLYNMIMEDKLVSGDGSVQDMDIVDDYIDHISSDIQLDQELKVVVDAGNGIGGEVGVQLLEEIGCEVIPLYCDVDGNFPNHHPDPSVPKNLEDLISTVDAMDADLGIAFDGDADRLGVVTKEGEMIYSDRILMLFAQDILTRQPGASIIFDVKCTGHLPKTILKSGGQPIIWKTGHSFMKSKLKETNAALAGEMSGHFFFNERWFGFDDGIYSAARLLEILDQADKPITEVFNELPNSVSTPELNCKTEEGENYKFMDKFVKSASFPDAHLTTIDGIRADFGDGWGLVRCSNTTPCLVMRFDAENEEALERIKEEFKKEILKVDDSLQLPF